MQACGGSPGSLVPCLRRAAFASSPSWFHGRVGFFKFDISQSGVVFNDILMNGVCHI